MQIASFVEERWDDIALKASKVSSFSCHASAQSFETLETHEAQALDPWHVSTEPL